MKVKVFTFETAIDETTIQDWLDDHPSARLIGSAAVALSVIIFYVE